MANVDLIATWKTGCIPTLTNFTNTWFNPSKTENIIRKLVSEEADYVASNLDEVFQIIEASTFHA